MNVPDLHRRAAERFGDLVQAVKEDQWADPIPCADWNVRALVNHVVAENLWTPMLFGGSTVEEIGDRFDGDVLGTDPKAAWESSITAALKAVQSQGAMDRTVHLSFGDVPGREYAAQLFADYLVHSFDLARASEATRGSIPSSPQHAHSGSPRWKMPTEVRGSSASVPRSPPTPTPKRRFWRCSGASPDRVLRGFPRDTRSPAGTWKTSSEEDRPRSPERGAYQPRSFHSCRCGFSAPIVVSSPWPG